MIPSRFQTVNLVTQPSIITPTTSETNLYGRRTEQPRSNSADPARLNASHRIFGPAAARIFSALYPSSGFGSGSSGGQAGSTGSGNTGSGSIPCTGTGGITVPGTCANASAAGKVGAVAQEHPELSSPTQQMLILLEESRRGNLKFNIQYLEVPLFRPYVPSKDHGIIPCGPAALHTLTGVQPAIIMRMNDSFQKAAGGDPRHCDDAFVVAFLRHYGFIVIDLKDPMFQFSKDESPKIPNKLTTKHVVLTSQILCKEDASWFVHYDNTKWHGLIEVLETNTYDMISNPVMTAYLLWHQSWWYTAKPDEKCLQSLSSPQSLSPVS